MGAIGLRGSAYHGRQAICHGAHQLMSTLDLIGLSCRGQAVLPNLSFCED